MPKDSDLLSVRQAADAKGVRRQSIYEALYEGRLNGRKVGNLTLVMRDGAFTRYEPKPYRNRRRDTGGESPTGKEER